MLNIGKAGKIAVIALLLVVAMGMPGYGGEADSPSAVVRTFRNALVRGDMETVGRSCSKETLGIVGTFGSKLQAMLVEKGKITNTTETIDGNTAEVEVTYENGDSDSWHLIKEKGRWVVHETIDGK